MKKGWETRRLDDLCEVEYGTRVVNKRDGGTVYPVYGGGGATFFMDTSNREDCLVIARFAMSEQCTRFVKGKFFLNDSGLTIKPKNFNEISQRFLDLQIIYLNDYIYSLARGTAQKNLDVPAFRNVEINYPKSLSEQKEIVAILDKAFTDIAKAKDNAEQNLKNAKELFESYLQSVFSNKGDGWEETTLGEIIQIRNGRNQKVVLSDGGKYKIMGSAGNVMGYATDYICEAGTTIIGRKGNISKPIYIEEKFWNVDTAFGLFPKNERDLDKRFVYYLCLGIDFKSMNRGTTIPSLVKSELQTIEIIYPKSLKEQQYIVKKLDSLSAETKRLENIYQQKINDLEELKKSILQKAFIGELKNVKV